MPLLTIAGTTREIELIVFDKDGTLVDFNLLWAGKLVNAVEAVLAAAPGLPGLRARLFATLGIQGDGKSVIPESPLAVSTLAKLGMVTTVVLYQNGVAWHEAERLSRDIFMPAIEVLPRPQDISPIGDVSSLMQRLSDHGFRLAVFTSDDRNATMATLPILGIAGLVGAMVCGDDAIPGKPSGAGLLHLASHFAVSPESILMVGDSMTDMTSATDASIGWRVGVLSGTGHREGLARIAHHVVDDIHALQPAASGRRRSGRRCGRAAPLDHPEGNLDKARRS
jgi:phosphoglycolate phosphatase